MTTVLEQHDKLLTVKQTAELLGVSESALNQWRSNGRHELPYTRVGRGIRYRLRDINQWLDDRTRNHT